MLSYCYLRKIKKMLDLENSFTALESLPVAKYILLPINADLEKFKAKIEKMGFPCWIKLSSSLHKARIKAVKRCCSFEGLKKTHAEMKKRFGGSKFIVQEDIEGTEIIAGINEDRTFGKVLLLGAGGSLAEIIKDIEFRTLPVEKEEILSALSQLKIFKMLREENCNIPKLIDIIKKFSELDFKEADLNPIVVNEKHALIVDARVELS